MKEKIIRQVIDYMFIVRYWVVLILMSGLVWFTYHVYVLPGTTIRDAVAVFAGGSVLITVFYQLINYEYTQRRFKYDIKTSQNLLSFNVVLEWQKDYMTKHTNDLRNFWMKHKCFLEDGMPRKFQEELDKPENDGPYTSLMVVFNFLESVSLGIRQGIMDEEFVKGFFQSMFIKQYHRYQPYIEYRRRETQNPKIWENFTYLSDKWLSS